MDDATDDQMDDTLDEDEAARNFGALPGQQLFDDIGLAGWDERSVWGYDAGVGSFYDRRKKGSNTRVFVCFRPQHSSIMLMGQAHQTSQ